MQLSERGRKTDQGAGYERKENRKMDVCRADGNLDPDRYDVRTGREPQYDSAICGIEEDKKNSQDQNNQTMAGADQQQNDAESTGQEKQAKTATAVPTGDLSLEIRIGGWLLVSGTAIVGVLLLDHIRERKEEELDGTDTEK